MGAVKMKLRRSICTLTYLLLSLFNFNSLASDKLKVLETQYWPGKNINNIKSDILKQSKLYSFGEELNGVGSGTIVYYDNKAFYYIVLKMNSDIIISTLVIPKLSTNEQFITVTGGCYYENELPIIAIVDASKSLPNLPIKKAWIYSKNEKQFTPYNGPRKTCENEHYGL